MPKKGYKQPQHVIDARVTLLRGKKRTPEQLERARILHTGMKHTEATKRLISQKWHERNPSGKMAALHSPEANRKRALTMRGRPKSPLACLRMSMAKKGKPIPWQDRMIAQKRTPERRAKASANTIQQIKDGKMYQGYGKCGKFYSGKNRRLYHYRSELELMWYKKLEGDKGVRKFKVECRTIDYFFEGEVRRYVPDILVFKANGTREMLEIKPEGAFHRTPKNIAKWVAAGQWCAEHGIVFRVVGYKGVGMKVRIR